MRLEAAAGRTNCDHLNDDDGVDGGDGDEWGG